MGVLRLKDSSGLVIADEILEKKIKLKFFVSLRMAKSE